MRIRMVLCLVAVCLATGGMSPGKKTPLTTACSPESHAQWLVAAIDEVHSVKVGMTRAGVLRILQPQGGLSTTVDETFVSRTSPFIKVDVKFEPQNKGEGADITPQDRVVSVSRPYLGYAVMD